MSCEIDISPTQHRSQGSAPSQDFLDGDPGAYDRVFWLAYLSNGLTTIANAMLVRYADFVESIGGQEGRLGLIVGVGMVGSIAMRMVQGIGIDRYGASRIWRWAMAFYSLSLIAHLFLTAYGPAVFITRIAMQTSLAGIFGASLTFVSLRAPPQRMAEIIGTLGTSGFLGMLIGPLLSDWICRGPTVERAAINGLFITAAAIASAATLVTWLASSGHQPPTSYQNQHLGKLLQRYTPLTVALVSAAMGAGIAIPITFLRPFADGLHLTRIGAYFTVYALTAFVARLATRQMFMRFGNRPWILVGMTLLTVSFLLYLPVRTTWHLVIPGAIAGVAHAFLFPSVMSAGATVFPAQYRGVATSFMLAMFDVGWLLGAPIAGAFIEFAKHTSAIAYPALFAGVAAIMFIVTLIYGLVPERRPEAGAGD